MHKGNEKCFAVTAPGLSGVCAGELEALAIEGVNAGPGGVEFVAGLRDLYRANLWLRTASRVVVRVGEMKSRDFPDLFRKARRLPWGKFVRAATPVRVRATSRRSRLVHGERIAATVKAAIDRSLGRGAQPESGDCQLVLARIEDDVCTLSVDSSGDLLHRRGYRISAVPAPLRETLAAGILQRLGWDGSAPLVDPMCGSGTFLIEAALLAGYQPPGGGREFAFMGWPRYRPGLWRALLLEAARVRSDGVPPIHGFDRDAGAIAAAHANAERAGVLDKVALARQPLSSQTAPAKTGLLLCNPPYGGRLDRERDLGALYRALGQLCRGPFAGWRWAFLCPDGSLAQATGLPVEKVLDLNNGGLRVGLYVAG